MKKYVVPSVEIDELLGQEDIICDSPVVDGGNDDNGNDGDKWTKYY